MKGGAAMKKPPAHKSVRTTKAYDGFLKALYLGVKPRVEEIVVPPVRVIALTGNEPPAGRQFQDAVGVLYGIGYGLGMGLKFGKLRRPLGYFDYKVGALEVFWWSVGKELDIADPKTLRWQAYLMVPAFVTAKLVAEARRLAKAKHPEVRYETASLTTVDEGRSVQMLHIGRYDREQPTVDALHAYANNAGLRVTGRHHEIYISDPRRTPAAKLKTVIRLAVKPAAGAR